MRTTYSISLDNVAFSFDFSVSVSLPSSEMFERERVRDVLVSRNKSDRKVLITKGKSRRQRVCNDAQYILSDTFRMYHMMRFASIHCFTSPGLGRPCRRTTRQSAATSLRRLIWSVPLLMSESFERIF